MTLSKVLLAPLPPSSSSLDKTVYCSSLINLAPASVRYFKYLVISVRCLAESQASVKTVNQKQLKGITLIPSSKLARVKSVEINALSTTRQEN